MPDERSSAPLLRRDTAIPFHGIDPGLLTSIGRGAFVRTADWNEIFLESRLRTRILVVARRLVDESSVFCRAAALAQHGVPVFGASDGFVDLIVRGDCTRHNAPDVQRHHDALPADDVTVIEGIRVTTLDRTIYDVARYGSIEMAVIAFDAALHRLAWDDETKAYDESAAEEFRERVLERIRSHPGARGIRQARFVAEFADGRAQSPGESLTRLRMWQASLPSPELQCRVGLGGGRYALLDLALPTRGRWLEFDGEVKYTDEGMLAGRSADEVIAAQAARQAAIERVTGWRCDRLEFRHVRTIDAFAARQREIHLFR